MTFIYSCTFINSISCLPTCRSHAAIASEKTLFSLFPPENPKLKKFGHMVKKVKVNQGSSFEQTMIGQSPECYITIFIEISHLVPEKKIMEAFLAYMGVGAILVM